MPVRIICVTALLLTMTAAGATPFINEIHYDNDGSDVDEGVEIAGPAGTNLAGWSLVFYNGSTGAPYGSLALDGSLPDEGGGFGASFFATGSLQNGAPDGLALIDAESAVRQFLSYEGSFEALSGAAAGFTSMDIGRSEPADTPVGWSLQLIGTGLHYADFAWAEPSPASYGAINAGQFFAAVPLPPALLLLAGALATLAGARRRQPGDAVRVSSSIQPSN